jgi:hypothetical protein
VVVIHYARLPFLFGAYFDLDEAVWYILKLHLGQKLPHGTLLLTLLGSTNPSCSGDCDTDDTVVRLMTLEVIDIVRHLDKEAVRKYGHAIDDTEDGLTNCAVNY